MNLIKSLFVMLVATMAVHAQNGSTFPLASPATGTKLTLNAQGYVVLHFTVMGVPQTVQMAVGTNGAGTTDIMAWNTIYPSAVGDYAITIGNPVYNNVKPNMYMRVICTGGQFDYQWQNPDPPGASVSVASVSMTHQNIGSQPQNTDAADYPASIVAPNISVPFGPIPLSMFPAAGQGGGTTFTADFSDGNGWQDLAQMQIVFSSTANPDPLAPNSCVIVYSPPGWAPNTVLLMDDAADWGWISGIVGQGVIANSQCSIDLAHVTVSPSGQDLSVSLPISFTARFNGPKTVWGFSYAWQNFPNVYSGWVQIGTWNVIAGQPPQF